MTPILQTSCILAKCRRRIPLKRQRRNAITCSTKCQKRLVKLRKQERDRRICQQCGRPCTTKEKTEFRRWRTEKGRSTHRHSKKSHFAQKGILAPAEVIKTIAYVCEDGPKKRKQPISPKGIINRSQA